MGRPRIYRHVWEEVASLNADYATRWGAFDGYSGPIELNGPDVTGAHYEHDKAADTVSLFYTPKGSLTPLRAVFGVHRQRTGYGVKGLFLAPCCGRRCIRLALLREGVRCAQCGSITTRTRRVTRPQRAIYRAEALAADLGCASWSEPPTKRPEGMSLVRFLRLSAEHAEAVALAQTLLQPVLEKARQRGAFSADVVAAL